VSTLPVDVVRSARRTKTVQAREVDGRLRVLIPSSMSVADERLWVAEMQRRVALLDAEMDDDALSRRAAALARRYALPIPESVRWSDGQSHRWGSCTPATATIRISARLARAPSWVLDYVLVHELAHLVIPSHDARFRTLLARYPKTERARGFLEGWALSEPAAATVIVGLDHVQLAMPAGREDEAEAFYSGLLGIPRVPKPAVLAARGGCWFERGQLRVHLGVEDDFRPARKAHPALAVQGLAALVESLRAAGYEIRDGEGLDGIDQAYVDDPFGNRIELLERA